MLKIFKDFGGASRQSYRTGIYYYYLMLENATHLKTRLTYLPSIGQLVQIVHSLVDNHKQTYNFTFEGFDTIGAVNWKKDDVETVIDFFGLAESDEVYANIDNLKRKDVFFDFFTYYYQYCMNKYCTDSSKVIGTHPSLADMNWNHHHLFLLMSYITNGFDHAHHQSKAFLTVRKNNVSNMLLSKDKGTFESMFRFINGKRGKFKDFVERPDQVVYYFVLSYNDVQRMIIDNLSYLEQLDVTVPEYTMPVDTGTVASESAVGVINTVKEEFDTAIRNKNTIMFVSGAVLLMLFIKIKPFSGGKRKKRRK